MTATLAVEGDAQRAALTAAQNGNHMILLVPHVGGKFSTIGTVAQVVKSVSSPTGGGPILKGLHRARLGGGQSDIGGALWVQVEPLPDGEPTDAARELAREYRALIENLLELRGAARIIEAVRSVRHPGHLADLSGYSPDLSIEQKLEILETLDLEQRLSRLIAWTKDVLADASVREKVRTEVNEGMEKTQRDFLLRQQLEAIKKQLGEGGDDVAAGYRGRLENAGMPENVRPRSSASWTASSGPASRALSTAGSGPTSTGCSRSHGTSGPRTTLISQRRGASSTRTIPVSRM